MLKNNNTMGDAHDDVQLEGIGGDPPPHVHKIYKPGGHPQTDTKEHRPTMTMMEVKTARPQVTWSIELIEDQLVYQKRTGNVARGHREKLDIKLSGEGYPIPQREGHGKIIHGVMASDHHRVRCDTGNGEARHG